MTLAAVIAAALAATLSLARWLRVSQREHYLPASVIVTARRWLTRRPPNVPLALLWVGVGSASLGLMASAPQAAASAGVVAAAIGVVFPIGMPVVGNPRLRLTRRATLQAGVAALLTAVIVTGLAFLMALGPAAGAAPVVAALCVDTAAWVNRPLERRLAIRYRRSADKKLQRSRPRVVAITGSYGKTTVKNHIRDLVSAAFDTLATPASWNNMAGLSRAINEQLTPSTEVFVAEMGTYGPGEITEMVEWLRPEVAVICAIGPVHLERMRSLETIAAAKSEILQGARTAVICADSPLLREIADRVRTEGTPKELWVVGSDARHQDLDVAVGESSRGTSSPGKSDTLTVRVHGEHLADLARGSLHPSNVACAVAAALALGVDRRVLCAVLPRLAAPTSRAVAATTENGITVVDDTFNSNPAGARAAHAMLERLVPNGRRVVVTPGMVELGQLQHDANKTFAEEVSASRSDLVIVGWVNRRALLSGHPAAITVRDREAARRWVRENLGHGDGVLWENDLPDHYP